jgi:hypothetical protein
VLLTRQNHLSGLCLKDVGDAGSEPFQRFVVVGRKASWFLARFSVMYSNLSPFR